MTTFFAKAQDQERKWFVIDAAGIPLGRIATEAARLLRGKHKPTFTPNVDTGDHVIIINAAKLVLTGNKLNAKIADITTEGYTSCSLFAETTVIIDAADKSEIQLFGAPKIDIRKFADESKLFKKLK